MLSHWKSRNCISSANLLCVNKLVIAFWYGISSHLLYKNAYDYISEHGNSWHVKRVCHVIKPRTLKERDIYIKLHLRVSKPEILSISKNSNQNSVCQSSFLMFAVPLFSILLWYSCRKIIYVCPMIILRFLGPQGQHQWNFSRRRACL